MMGDYEEHRMLCYCGLRANMWTCWKVLNSGRRFFGCPQYPIKFLFLFLWYS